LLVLILSLVLPLQLLFLGWISWQLGAWHNAYSACKSGRKCTKRKFIRLNLCKKDVYRVKISSAGCKLLYEIQTWLILTLSVWVPTTPPSSGVVILYSFLLIQLSAMSWTNSNQFKMISKPVLLLMDWT
jgi:hypothetical protein